MPGRPGEDLMAQSPPKLSPAPDLKHIIGWISFVGAILRHGEVKGG